MALAPDFMEQVSSSYGDPEKFCRLVFGTPDPDLPGLHAGQRRYAANALAEVNFLLPGNSWGKSLRNGMPVLRPDGSWTPIEGLRPGDSVVGGDGLPTTVLGVFPQGKRPIYRLHFQDGWVDCDEDHLWFDSRRDRVVRTGDVIKRKSRKAALCVPTARVEMPERPLPVGPYVLGALLGDGTLWGHASRDKFVPEDYLYNSAENRLALLRGLMDTGGWVSGSQVGFCSMSQRLAENVAFVVRSLGGFARLDKKTSGAWSVSVTLTECPFRLSRKVEAWRVQHHARTRPHDRVLRRFEFIGNHEATCIKVANPDGLFVTKDFIVTHNTEFICRYMTYLAWFKVSRYGVPQTFEEWLTLKWKGLVASYTYPIAKESFERFLHYYRSREELRALCAKAPLSSDPVRVEFANGSVVDWGSLDGQGKLVEAARRQAIMVDEAGHIPDISATFDNILFPRTMGVGGSIHLLGTPKAHSDPYLLEVYEKGKDGRDPFYYSQAGSVLENEYWREEERERVFSNPRYVSGWTDCDRPGDCSHELCRGGMHPILTQVGRQVILGAFVIAGGYFFNRFAVGRMFSDDHGETPNITWEGEHHFHQGEWERNPQGIWIRKDTPPKGRLYLGAFDLGGNKQKKRGTKSGSDPTVGFVLDYTERPWRVVHYEYIEGGAADWQQKYETMANVFTGYPMMYLLIDATGSIDSVQEALLARGVEVEGVQFGGSSSKKFDMLRNLQLCTEMEWSGHRGVIRCPPIPSLKHELDHYVLPDDHIKQDRVMALAMVAHHVAQWELPEAVSGEWF